MRVTELQKDEYNEFFQNYIDGLSGDDTLESLFYNNQTAVQNILNNLTAEKLKYKYTPEKWSIAEVLQHLLDVERIFQFRALSIARNDKTPLPGFDHNAYVLASEAEKRNLQDFKKDFEVVRKSTIFLFESFTDIMLKCKTPVGGTPTSVRALGFIIVGHTKHHLHVLTERYLK